MSDKQQESDEVETAQVALVHAYQAIAKAGRRVIVVMEGRDAAGKDGTLRRVTENLPARPVRVVSLPAPNERERTSWYFQRYIAQFPAGGEIVLFNRSWYNRAGVEPVMGFCTDEQTEEFLDVAPKFETLLVQSGFELIKYYLDISKGEQQERLEARAKDPLKSWKIGPMDAVALEKFDDYTVRRDQMLTRTHCPAAPWTIVRANKKPKARLAILRDLVARLAPDQCEKAGRVDPEVLRPFDAAALADGFLTR
jgi:polyphosphate kinase